MDCELRRRAAEIFADALERGPEDWEEFMRRSCGDDEWLRAEVESLLRVWPAARTYFRSRRTGGRP